MNKDQVEIKETDLLHVPITTAEATDAVVVPPPGHGESGDDARTIVELRHRINMLGDLLIGWHKYRAKNGTCACGWEHEAWTHEEHWRFQHDLHLAAVGKEIGSAASRNNTCGKQMSTLTDSLTCDRALGHPGSHCGSAPGVTTSWEQK